MVIGGVEVGALSLLVNRGDFDYHLVCVRGGDEDIISSLDAESRDRIYLCNGYFDAFLLLLKLQPKFLITSLWSSHLVGMFFSFVTRTARYHFVHNTNYAHVIDEIITRLSVKTARYIITDSEKTKEFLGKSNKNIYVAPMNVSFSKGFQRTFNNDLSFVFVGRFSQVKDIKSSVDFIDYLQSKGLNATLDLYGRDDGDQNNIVSYIGERDLSQVIKFKGVVEPLMAESIMRQYNFYLQTSIYEGMSISVFQSIVNGLTPVVTPVGEIPNYSSHNINAFHLNGNDKLASYQEFIDKYDDKFEGYEVGKVLNKEKYPMFYKTFFNIFEH